MSDIQIHNKVFSPFISPAEIRSRIVSVAAVINSDYEGKRPLLIAILNGAFIFAADLFRELSIEAEISFTKLSSYSGTSSTGQVVTEIGLEEKVAGRHVIIVEDIVDTGKTLSSFIPELLQYQPASVKVAAFLRKPVALRFDVKVDYFAFEIVDRFVVGYGLDYDGLGRNLPGLYKLKDE